MLALLLSTGPAALAAHSTGPNLIGNAAFARPLATAITTCGRLPLSIRSWLPYSQTPGYLPNRVTLPRHASSHALSVRGPALVDCSAYGAIEDLPAGALNSDQDFSFSLWVDPEQGKQTQELIVNWSRLNGAPSFAISEDVATHAVSFSAWGQTRLVHDELAAHLWHHLVLSVSAQHDTATLTVDGHSLGTTKPGSPAPSGQLTILLGQNLGSESSLSNYYYDGISLTASSG